MRMICDTQSLTAVCLDLQRCIPNRSVIPHLEGILFQTVDETTVRMSGFDLDLGITTLYHVNVEEQGSIVLNAKRFCDILRKLNGETVFIDCDDKNVCTIRSGGKEYTLIGLSAEDYPELPTVTDGMTIAMRQTVLRDMIRQTIFAVSMDDSKSVHRGIKFEIEPGQIRLIALDGFRLAIRNEFLQYDGEPIKFVVPGKALAEIIKFITDEDVNLELFKGRRHIVFRIGEYQIISRLLEGEFLDYRSAIPSAKSTTVRVNVADFIECIDSTTPMMTEKAKSPTKFIFDEDMVKISAITTVGTFKEKMPCSVSGKRVEIGFNNKFILDALRSVDADEVLINLNGPIQPGIFLPVDGDSFLYLILPVKIKN